MPHHRERYLETNIMKSLKFWPVVCLVGSRQVGKSTLLKGFSKFTYVTLDDHGALSLAEKNPKAILSPPCIIDEAQKSPLVFDAVKQDVDNEKRPGKYVLTGSVRFSKRTLIRESLTGRAKTVQMYPMTCSESLSLPFEKRWWQNDGKFKARIERKHFQRYLRNGGMPAIFSARSGAETSAYWRALIDSYVHRDLLLALPKNPRPPVAMTVLRIIAEILALGELPTFARILKKSGSPRTMIERHLIGLEDMMILNRIHHWGASSAKDIFMPFDPAFFLNLLKLENPNHDAAIHEACLYITLINEVLAAQQIVDDSSGLSYALSPKGELVHLIMNGKAGQTHFWKISEEAIPHDYQLRFLRSLIEKHNGSGRVLSSIDRTVSHGGISISPWESVL